MGGCYSTQGGTHRRGLKMENSQTAILEQEDKAGNTCRPRFTSIRLELRERKQWVVWKYVDNPDGPKPKKVPFDPATLQWAKTNAPESWGSFDEAVARYEGGGYEGIGYVFSADDPYCGIDLDKCIEPPNSDPDNRALGIINDLVGYTERSPSGTGVHIIVRAALPRAMKKAWIEMYDRGRYFTFTGDVLGTAPETIPDAQPAVSALLTKHRGTAPATATSSNESRHDQPSWPDNEIIGRAKAKPDGKKLPNLLPGQWAQAGFPSQSEADLSVCSTLARVGATPEQVDRIFRSSSLHRP